MSPNVYPYPIPKPILIQKLRAFLETDIGFGDLSAGLIPKDATGKAKITAKSAGVLAGGEETQILFEDMGIDVNLIVEDGVTVENGAEIIHLEGNLRAILMAERTALNILMKMSSIAASTSDLVTKIRAEKLNTILATTRKITPGFGWFEKKAVYLGGGDTHRWNLSDMILCKDTHLKFYGGKVKTMIEQAKSQVSFSKKVEVEVEREEDIPIAIESGADIIMFDNFSPKMIFDSLKKNRGDSHILFEASGNITHANLLDYAKSGVDIISTSQVVFHPHIHVDYSLTLE